MAILGTFRWFSVQDIVVSTNLSIIYFRKQFLRTNVDGLSWLLVATLSFGRACWWGRLVEHRFIVVLLLLVVYSTIFRFDRLLDSRKVLHTFGYICSILVFCGWINSTIGSFLAGLHGLFLFYLTVRFGENGLLLGSLDAFWGQHEAGLLLLISFNDTSQSDYRIRFEVDVARLVLRISFLTL